MISKSALKLFSDLAAICVVALGSAVTEAASKTSNNLTIAPPVPKGRRAGYSPPAQRGG
jgi:hypothetical protein